MDVAALVNQGWDDHAADPAGVLQRLLGALAHVTEANTLAVAGLATHVAGEHLGRWADGIALLAELSERKADPTIGAALQRSMASLYLGAGDHDAAETALARGMDPERSPASSRIRVYTVAACALVGQGQPERAAALFEEALALAAYGPDASDPAARALAMAGNNLACELEERAQRSPSESELMLRAALTGRRYWAVAGNWENVKIAEYRLAQSHLKAGLATVALGHALASVALCDEYEGGPGTRVFPWLAVAQARHALERPDAAREALRSAQAARASAGTALGSWVDDGIVAVTAELG